MSTPVEKKTHTVVITEDREEGGYVGRCGELHAHSQGETYGEMMENMKEATGLASYVMHGTRDFNTLVVCE